MTSGAKADGRFGKQDFVYLPMEDAYRCPAGEKLTYRYTNEEDGKTLRRYWTTACSRCPLKPQCTTGPERRITRWEHEHVLEAVQQRSTITKLVLYLPWPEEFLSRTFRQPDVRSRSFPTHRRNQTWRTCSCSSGSRRSPS
jgi:hypothetical protein